jgi:serine/threonine-protein kinase
VPTLRPGDAVPPPPANKSLASAFGVGATAEDAAAAEAKAAKAVDMDWDDEEESTHVYDKGKHGDVSSKMRPAAGTPMAPKASAAAAALLASSGTAAASARTVSLPPPVSAPPPVAPPSAAPSIPMPPSSVEPARAKSARDEPTSVRSRPAPPQASGGKAGVVLGGLALAAVIGLGAFLLIPRTGVLKIDVKGKGGTGVARAEVFVDGQKRCDTAPCVVSDLSTGPKVIKVLAPDAAPVDVTETVEAGREKFVSVTIDTAAGMVGAANGSASGSPTATTATGGTGFKATGNQPGVKVLVDGTDKGALPLELTSLTPGSHKVRFEGDRYEAKDETVEVVANQVKEVPVKLKVLKGSLTLELATAGASVTLASLTGKKDKKQLDSVLKVNKPVKLSDIDATQTWKLIASKKGMPEFTQEVSFEDGMPEKSIRIELGGEAEKPAPVAVAPGPGPGPKPNPGPGPATPPVTPPKETPAASGSGTLNINSIPVSKVVLDGKPLGSTPKVGVSVPAGNHTVTFIHPELGKKSVTVAVKAGETKTAAVKFDKPAE